MTHDIQTLLEEYTQWLKDKTTTRNVNGWIEVTTPYLDRHNDAIQLYVRAQNNRYLLTDGGYIINDLEMSGCSLDTPRRKQVLNETLNGFGVQLRDNQLEVTASKENFPLKKHNLVQAMLAVNDMFYLATPLVASIFVEDVAAWFDENDIQ